MKEYNYKTIHVEKETWIELKQLAMDKETSIKEIVKLLVEGKLKYNKFS